MRVDPIQTLREQVTDKVRDLILQGSFSPGDKLKQSELAASIGVSAVPVREAIRQLHAEGLVELAPRRGAFVPTFTLEELEELSYMREELESLAVRRAAPKIAAQDVEHLRALLQRIEAAESHLDVASRSTLVWEFLSAIFAKSEWSYLQEQIQRLYNMTYLYLRQYSAVFRLAEQRIQIYRQLLDALADRDGEAAVAAHRENYRLFRETMKQAFLDQSRAPA